MNELIKITTNENQEQIVNARDLHEFLEIKTVFKDWIARSISDFDFIDGQDFSSFLSESTGGRPSKEYHLKMDMAKELSMLARNEKGKQARKYFIECEKKLQQPQQLSRMDILKIAMDAEKKVLALQEKNEYQLKQIEEQKPLVNFATAIENSSNSINVGTFVKLLNNDGIKIGRNRFFEWLRNKGYLIVSGAERNNPKQQYEEQGLFEIRQGVVTTIKGSMNYPTTLITGKGQMYFLDKMQKEFGQQKEVLDLFVEPLHEEKPVIDEKVEIWRDVLGYEGIYQISNKGRLKSLKRTVIATKKSGLKYERNIQSVLMKEVKLNQGNKYSLCLNNKTRAIRTDVLLNQAFPEFKKDGKK